MGKDKGKPHPARAPKRPHRGQPGFKGGANKPEGNRNHGGGNRPAQGKGGQHKQGGSEAPKRQGGKPSWMTELGKRA